MASLRQIRRRMKSIENINEITKAMEMISAFRFKRAEGRFSKSRAYFAEMERLVANLASAGGAASDELFAPRAVRHRTLVVLAGDKGLCGSYNAQIFRAAAAWARDNASASCAVMPVGKIACDHFRKRTLPILEAHPDKASMDLEKARRLAGTLVDAYRSGATDSVEILYSSFKLGGSGAVRTSPYLGLGYLTGAQPGTGADYLYEPDWAGVFRPLVSSYLEGRMYILILESLTSEYAARMSAMKQATENGEEVLDSLKLLRNKTRQATITRELSEIVGGASVLV